MTVRPGARLGPFEVLSAIGAGRYCIAFGGAVVDRRLSELLLEVISPPGVEASLRALEQLRGQDDERRAARRQALGEVDDGQGPRVQETA